MLRAGLPWRANLRVLPTEPRLVHAMSLSDVWEV